MGQRGKFGFACSEHILRGPKSGGPHGKARRLLGGCGSSPRQEDSRAASLPPHFCKLPALPSAQNPLVLQRIGPLISASFSESLAATTLPVSSGGQAPRVSQHPAVLVSTLHQENAYAVFLAMLVPVPAPAKEDAMAGGARGWLSPPWGAEEGEVGSRCLGRMQPGGKKHK